MAVIRTSSLVGSIVGSIGGTNFQRGRTGILMRNNPRRVRSNSQFSSRTRDRMAQLSISWKTKLTHSQRGAWNLYAAHVPVPNALGLNHRLTGLNHFIRSNRPWMEIHAALITDAPQIYRLTNTPVFEDLYLYNYPAFTVVKRKSYSGGEWFFEDDAKLWCYLGHPIPTTRTHYSGSYYFLGELSGSSSATYPWEGFWLTYMQLTSALALPLKLVCSMADGRTSIPATYIVRFP